MAISSTTPVLDAPEKDSGRKFSQALFRTWPYWPLLLLSLVLGVGASWAYLQYATPYYEANAQIVVNDDSQDKDNNLNPATVRPDQRYQLSEIEKQIEIIQSKSLLEEVVRKMKLDIQWTNKKSLRREHLYTELPAGIELFSPDSLMVAITGLVKINAGSNTIEFNNRIYPADSIVSSPMGKCRWHINREIINDAKNELMLALTPVSNAAVALQRRFKVTPVSKQSSILDLSIVDEVAERGVQTLNTIIDLYGAQYVNNKKQILDNSLAFIDGRLLLVSEDLNGAESSLQNYKSKAGITDLATEGQIYLGQVKENDRRISEMDVQLSVLQQIEAYVSRRNTSADPVPATLGLSDQVLVTLLNQLFQDEFELERLRKITGEKSDNINILKDRIEQRKQSILQSVKNLRLSLDASRQALKSTNSSFSQSLGSIPQKERSLVDINRNKNIKNDLYNFLLQKREETAIAAAAISPNYRIIEKPENYGLIKPRPVIIFLYGAVISLLLGGLIIYKKEFGNSRILYRSEIENRTAIPVIGEIIFDAAGSSDKIVVGAETRTLIAEQFRELRTNINFMLREEPKGRILLMTSSVPKEGKSFISINLSMSLAMTGKKTVLLEFDLYKPAISQEMGITYDKGLGEYFKGEATLDEICVQYHKEQNLWIIPCGAPVANPAELILNGKLPGLMEELKQRFEYIVLDTPCVGIVSDPKILAPYANISLYVIRQNYSHHGFMKFLNELNDTGSIPNLRIVFNGIKIKKAPGLDYWDTYGYNGYRYGSKNGYTQPSKKKRKYRAQD